MLHFLNWRNLHKITVMIQGYYIRVRAAAVQMVYTMDAKSLIQESLFLNAVSEPLCAVRPKGCDFIKKSMQSQITQPYIANTILKTFFRKKQINDRFLKTHW